MLYIAFKYSATYSGLKLLCPISIRTFGRKVLCEAAHGPSLKSQHKLMDTFTVLAKKDPEFILKVVEWAMLKVVVEGGVG